GERSRVPRGSEDEAVAAGAVALVLPRPARVLGRERIVDGLDAAMVDRRPPALDDAAVAGRYAPAQERGGDGLAAPTSRDGSRRLVVRFDDELDRASGRAGRDHRAVERRAERLDPGACRVGVRAEGPGPQRVDV